MAIVPLDKAQDGTMKYEADTHKEGEWVEVLRTQNTHRANLVRAVLEEHYIPAVVLSQRDSSYNAFGNLRVLVPGTMHATAMEILRGDAELDGEDFNEAGQ